jgi:sterol desaturase/sphingolipid hydroxylase (fatty acid hydroxylase superfamily)
MTWFDFIYHRILFTEYGAIGFVILMYLAFTGLEIFFTAERQDGLSARTTNLVVTAIFLGFGGWLARTTMLAGPQEHRIRDRGMVFSIALVVAYGFVQNLLYYWYHRAQHSFSFLWVIHELHHTDTAVNATTSLRTFWLEAPLQALLLAIPAHWIVGLDARATMLLPAVFTAWLIFTHSNWKLSLGFLTPIVCGPQLHRIHHSNLPEHQDKNFAQYFPCIDILFGTYWAPRRDEFPTTGVGARTAEASLAEITISPFQEWTKSFLRVFAAASKPKERTRVRSASRRRRRTPQRRRRAR